MIEYLNKLYPNLPVSLQNLMCTAYGYNESRKRFGGQFAGQLKSLKKSESWTLEEIRVYQLRELNSLLKMVLTHVPYYRKAYGLPADFQLKKIEDFNRLPILTKDKVRNNLRSLISDRYRVDQLQEFHTSGTTGKPLTFYRTAESIAFQWAIWSRHKERFGVRYNDYHALFTGKPVVPLAQNKPPYWRINRGMNQVVFSMQHIHDETIADIVKKLSTEHFSFYTGYPSIIYQVAITALRHNLSVKDGPKVIFTGAEPLYGHQREAIERAFGCEVTDQYGTSEGVANASRCTYGNYHEDFEFGYLEVIPDEFGDDPAVGQILMTGFSNDGMPFIRYQIGDRGKLVSSNCPCGRKSRTLSSIEGRIEDFVLTPEGNRITRFDYIFKGVKGLAMAQILQSEYGSITIRVVLDKDSTGFRKDDLVSAVRKYISQSIKIEFQEVNEIARSATGKFRAVVNTL